MASPKFRPPKFRPPKFRSWRRAEAAAATDRALGGRGGGAGGIARGRVGSRAHVRNGRRRWRRCVSPPLAPVRREAAAQGDGAHGSRDGEACEASQCECESEGAHVHPVRRGGVRGQRLARCQSQSNKCSCIYNTACNAKPRGKRGMSNRTKTFKEAAFLVVLALALAFLVAYRRR